ncbi:NAD(P)/FAD-dependent oxidoreductase [Priestia endophytica]|uniref:FAD-dependent oxidoreductase n=1 Tax=Priestia endophytica TaxID=135735 RepID=UPI003D2E7824
MKYNQKHIAIIGAGIGGLTLARILQRNGIECTVYEKELSQTFRQQGGTLDLQKHTGQFSLKQAELLDEFKQLARYEGQDFRILDKTGKVYLDQITEPNQKDRPEIDRGVLRNLLLNSIHPLTIKWGHTLDKVVDLGNGQHKLYFTNKHTDIADLVVGADGAFSRIRSLVSKAEPEYTGLSMIELHLSDVERTYPHIANFNGPGSMYAFADQKAIISQLNGDGNIRVYLTFKVEKSWLDDCGIPFNQPIEARRNLIYLFEDWTEELKNYIRYAEDSLLTRRIYMLPFPHKWTYKQGVTLIGDAAHLMSPFAGEGANLAMLDAAELALSIIRHHDLNEAIQVYETKMFNYASESAEMSDKNLKLCFSENPAAKFAAAMG